MFRIAGFLLGVTLATLALLTLIETQRGEAVQSDVTVQSPFLESPLPSRERARERVQTGQGTERLQLDSLDRALSGRPATHADAGATDEKPLGEQVGHDAPLLATAAPAELVVGVEAESLVNEEQVGRTGARADAQSHLSSVAEPTGQTASDAGVRSAADPVDDPFELDLAGADTPRLATPVEPPRQDEHAGRAAQSPQEMLSAGIEEWGEAEEPVDAEIVSVLETEALPAVPDWHVFWSPFRSALSARGFAARLGRVTGAEFKVIEQGLGQYAVAFRCADETERLARLAEIQAETGLAVLEEE